MSRLVPVALFMALLVSGRVQGGAWSSMGGGEIIEQAQNPWFLDGPKPTAPIKYCIASDAAFAVAPVVLEKVVDGAFRWWKNQFGNAAYPDNPVYMNGGVVNLHVAVNASRYVYGPCGNDTDITFQFGTLVGEQEAKFKELGVDLTRFVALTIRTDYSADLRGRGFVYVSPDRGPRAFQGQNVWPEAWTASDETGSRLQSVLTHELGHVFGLAHATSNDSIMSARYPELIVSKLTISEFPILFAADNAVFFPKAGVIGGAICQHLDETRTFRRFFEIADDIPCIRVSVSLSGLVVDMGDDRSPTGWRRVGIAHFPDGGQRRYQQLVRLSIPPVQTAYEGLPSYITSLLGPAASEVQHTAVFEMSGSGVMSRPQ